MQKRSPITVALLGLFTFGIYSLYWMVVTTQEMRKLGAQIPTVWLIIVPIVNIWWMWKYCEGVEHVTAGKTSAVIAFLLIWLLGFIGSAIVQMSFNEVDASAVHAAAGNAGVSSETASAPAPAMAAAIPVDAAAPAPAPSPTPPADTTPPAATPPASTPPNPPLVQ